MRPEARLNAGIAYWKMEDAKSARKAFADVLSLRPKSVDALRGLAALTLANQDYDQAFTLHKKLLQWREESGTLLQRRADRRNAANCRKPPSTTSRRSHSSRNLPKLC